MSVCDNCTRSKDDVRCYVWRERKCRLELPQEIGKDAERYVCSFGVLVSEELLVQANAEITCLRAEVERLTAENASLAADAKLGRMVRAMPDMFALWVKDKVWSVEADDTFSEIWQRPTPEEALAAAGVKE